MPHTAHEHTPSGAASCLTTTLHKTRLEGVCVCVEAAPLITTIRGKYAKICTFSAQTCESWPAKRKYARRPEARWLRKYANCDKYRSTRFTNSPPQTRDNRVPIPILFCSPPVASLIASFQCAKTCVSYKGFRQRVLVGRVSCYGACLRKCASPTPAPRQNRPNAKICTGDYPGADCENMHSAKIILSPHMFAIRSRHPGSLQLHINFRKLAHSAGVGDAHFQKHADFDQGRDLLKQHLLKRHLRCNFPCFECNWRDCIVSNSGRCSPQLKKTDPLNNYKLGPPALNLNKRKNTLLEGEDVGIEIIIAKM